MKALLFCIPFILVIKGAAGEAAEVLSWSQIGLCDGQVKSWSEPSGPHC